MRRTLAAQPNTVVVLIHGNSLSSALLAQSAPAVLAAWFGGELGGDAIVDALDGTISPAGKMPVTTYHANFTQRDVRVTDLRADGGITYRWFAGPVQTPFGFGLSYSTFSYKWAERAPPREAAATSELRVSYDVTVVNTGTVASDCVVLGFLTAVAGSHADTPLRRLFEFTRLLALQPGEARDVHFALGAKALRFTDRDGRPVLASAGRVGVEIGDVVAPLRHELQLV